jgi:hypothetical protein
MPLAEPSAGRKVADIIKIAQFIVLPLAIAQQSLGYSVDHLNADPWFTVIPRTESTELGEYARRP